MKAVVIQGKAIAEVVVSPTSISFADVIAAAFAHAVVNISNVLLNSESGEYQVGYNIGNPSTMFVSIRFEK